MVGTSRDAAELLADLASSDLDQAVASGSLRRFKVRGRWIYSYSEASETEILDEALRAVEACLDEWLLGSNPFLRNAAAGRTESPIVTRSAMDILIHELCSEGRIHPLALLNAHFQPYFAYYSESDRNEVQVQLDEMRAMLSRDGRVGWRDLPEPSQGRENRAWRMLVLGHGEFLGLGWLKERRELITW